MDDFIKRYKSALQILTSNIDLFRNDPGSIIGGGKLPYTSMLPRKNETELRSRFALKDI